MSVTSNSLFGHAGMATAEIGYPPGSNLEMSTLVFTSLRTEWHLLVRLAFVTGNAERAERTRRL
jgi:hypothetical protein